MKQIGFVLEYSKGLSLVSIETFRKKKRNSWQKSAYIRDCKKRFSTPEGQGLAFNEFLKSLKYGDRIVITKFEKQDVLCGLCQEKIGLDDQVRYTKVDGKEEPVHEDCWQDAWYEAHAELESRFG